MRWYSEVSFYFLFWLHWKRSPPTAVSWTGRSREGNIWGTFSSPFPMLWGVSSAILESAAQTLRLLLNITSVPVSNEWPYSMSCLCAGLWLRLPVYLHLSLCRLPVAIGLEVIGWDKGWLMSCPGLGLKRSRFAWSQPHSTHSGESDPVARQGQDGWRPEGMQEQTEGDEYISQLLVELHSWFSVGVFSLTLRVASYWHTPPGFDDICLHIHIYCWTLAIEVNGSKFIIQSGSRQIKVHLLLYYH